MNNPAPQKISTSCGAQVSERGLPEGPRRGLQRSRNASAPPKGSGIPPIVTAADLKRITAACATVDECGQKYRLAAGGKRIRTFGPRPRVSSVVAPCSRSGPRARAYTSAQELRFSSICSARRATPWSRWPIRFWRVEAPRPVLCARRASPRPFGEGLQRRPSPSCRD
jgi:hypothetical protein